MLYLIYRPVLFLFLLSLGTTISAQITNCFVPSPTQPMIYEFLIQNQTPQDDTLTEFCLAVQIQGGAIVELRVPGGAYHTIENDTVVCFTGVSIPLPAQQDSYLDFRLYLVQSICDTISACVDIANAQLYSIRTASSNTTKTYVAPIFGRNYPLVDEHYFILEQCAPMQINPSILRYPIVFQTNRKTFLDGINIAMHSSGIQMLPLPTFTVQTDTVSFTVNGNTYPTMIGYDPSISSYTITPIFGNDTIEFECDSDTAFVNVNRSYVVQVDTQMSRRPLDFDGLFVRSISGPLPLFNFGGASFRFQSNCSNWGFAADAGSVIMIQNVLSSTTSSRVKEALNVFPNPFQTELVLEVLGGNELGKITVVNSLGQVVFEQFIDSNIYTLQTSHWSQGVYYVSLVKGSKRLTRKIVKT